MLGLPAQLAQYPNQRQQTKIILLLRFDHFQKPFDSIWRNGLLLKLLDNKIAGKFYRFIADMYSR